MNPRQISVIKINRQLTKQCLYFELVNFFLLGVLNIKRFSFLGLKKRGGGYKLHGQDMIINITHGLEYINVYFSIKKNVLML